LTSSTRRFFARPASSLFGATGRSWPNPRETSRSAAIPPAAIAPATALARAGDSAWLRAGVLTLVTWRDYQKRIYERVDVHSNAEFQALFA
jgi:hypothetical protein